jgi:hypothetical protein
MEAAGSRLSIVPTRQSLNSSRRLDGHCYDRGSPSPGVMIVKDAILEACADGNDNSPPGGK